MIESDYFDDRSSYMLIYGVYVDELFEFVMNEESKERIVISKEDFIKHYDAGDKKQMKKVIDLAWELLAKSS